MVTVSNVNCHELTFAGSSTGTERFCFRYSCAAYRKSERGNTDLDKFDVDFEINWRGLKDR